MTRALLPRFQRERGITRRAALASLGSAAVLSPFLPLLNASGQEGTPRRLVLWFTPHGTIYDNWKPSGTATDFTLGPILEPLTRHQGKLAVLDGVDILAPGVGAPHTKGPPLLWTASSLKEDMTFTREDGSGGMYYGWNSGPSIDQVIAERLALPTPYKSLEFGVRSGGNHPGSRMIYTGPEQPLTPESNPWAAYSRLIGAIGENAEQAAARRLERRSVLDVVGAELAALEGRVSAQDRLKVQSHLSSVREIETRLELAPNSCEALDLGQELDAGAVDNTPATFDRQMELLAAALSCDLTRVASLQFRVGENDGGYPYHWLGITAQEHHLLTHEPDENAEARAQLSSIYRWYADRFAYFLDLLDAVPEGNGTLLDNTLVIWGSELGKGNSHAFERVPFVVAGGGARGRYLQYESVEHNRLLVSAAHFMGVTDMQSFGGTDPASGLLPGLDV